MAGKHILRSQKGFTLIEIISVLVLLGILAAVAVPKFIDLQTDAKNKAAEAAVSEGIAQVNLYAAKYILQNGSVPGDLADLTAVAIGLDDPYTEGDFVIDFEDGAAGEINIQADGAVGSNVEGALATGIAYLPQ